VKCGECGFASQPDARFCGGCGARIDPRKACPSCGTANPPENNYCSECGERLAAASTLPSPTTPEGGERRQLTVLFCDLVGSTRLSTLVDAEDLQDFLKTYYQACTRVIERFDGYVANYLGDGVLAHFGFPRAHEDDAVRSVNAALAMLEVMEEVREKARSRFPHLAEQPPAVRIAIHTGQVVVGDTGVGSPHERVAVGDTLNIAAKLQSAAAPNTVVISDSTQALVQGLFVLEELGPVTLAGLDTPLRAHRVLRPSGVVARIDVAAAKGLTKFIGRDQEVNFLLERWQHASEGLGQAVLVSGDAGVGKTRLLQRVRARLANRPHVWLEASGSVYHTASVFYPIIELIERGISLEKGDDTATRIEKLEQALAQAGLPLDDVLPLFASLISVPVPPRYTSLDPSQQSSRRRTFEALLAWVFTLADTAPVILVMDDLQWMDASSLELLGMIIEQAPTGRVLVLMTARPEFHAPWAHQAHVSSLHLTPLTRRQTRRLIEAVLGERELDTNTMDSLVAKCDGVPLFAEELTRAVLEGVTAAARLIPSSLQDSLMARLDLLGPAAKEVAQIASVLGREFSHEMLCATVSMNETALEEAVDVLGDADLLYRRGIAPRAVYMFKHALIQEIAYESLLRARRTELHARSAGVLEDKFPDVVAHAPELVAFHHAEAKQYAKAADFYGRAGRLAKERTASAEAAEHFRRAIEMVEHLPESAERHRDELRLLVALGGPLIATRGYADEEVRRTFERARTLCAHVGDERDLFEAVYGHSAYCLNRAEMERARFLSRRLLELAHDISPPSPLPWAHQQMGCVVYWCGDPVAATKEFDAAVDAYDPDTHRPLIQVFGQDARVASMALGALTKWLAGRWPDATAASLRAIELGRAAGHPFSLGFALCFAAYNHVQIRDRPAVRAFAEEALELSREHGIRQWDISSNLLLGWAMDNAAEGIARMEATFAEAQQLGSRIGAPFQVYMLADRQVDAGRIRAASETIRFALDLSRDTQNRFWDAELRRLEGDVALRGDPADRERAVTCYRSAIETACAQGARSLELRAVVSSARLAVERGERSGALELLSPSFDDLWRDSDSPDARAAAELVAAAS